jgi:hypothetical protein
LGIIPQRSGFGRQKVIFLYQSLVLFFESGNGTKKIGKIVYFSAKQIKGLLKRIANPKKNSSQRIENSFWTEKNEQRANCQDDEKLSFFFR